jgi:hypothetical protein
MILARSSGLFSSIGQCIESKKPGCNAPRLGPIFFALDYTARPNGFSNPLVSGCATTFCARADSSFVCSESVSYRAARRDVKPPFEQLGWRPKDILAIDAANPARCGLVWRNSRALRTYHQGSRARPSFRHLSDARGRTEDLRCHLPFPSKSSRRNPGRSPRTRLRLRPHPRPRQRPRRALLRRHPDASRAPPRRRC